MRTTITLTALTACILSGALAAGARASDDTDTPDWSEAGKESLYFIPIAGPDQGTIQKIEATNHAYYATTDLDENHVSTQLVYKFVHWHYRYDFGDPGMPSVDDTNNYWDQRLPRADRQTAPTTKYNCFIYAAKTVLLKGDTDGVWGDYWINGTEADEMFDEDTRRILPIGDVQEDDILRITVPVFLPGDPNRPPLDYDVHASVVADVDNGKPTKIRFKWQSSGEYEWEPIAGHEFDISHDWGSHDTGFTPEQLGWTEEWLPLHHVRREEDPN